MYDDRVLFAAIDNVAPSNEVNQEEARLQANFSRQRRAKRRASLLNVERDDTHSNELNKSI